MKTYQTLALTLAVITSPVLSSAVENALQPGEYAVFPDRPKQKILGIGFEIQSDSIGSGNNGLPEAPIAVPHDLVPSERERLAKEMLSGFRYCRLAGGLYWRGLDPEGKFLQPRWPEQLQELKQLLDTAGVEGLSFEYWSPAPFWKANQSYTALNEKDGHARNRLRPFAPGFENDPVYRGDEKRFLKDFGDAVVRDITTLKEAGLKVSMFGLQNEPFVNHSIYSTCEYPDSPSYVKAYKAVNSAIRKAYPDILLFGDTESDFPHKLAPGMKDPEVAALVDAYVVHTIGVPSEHVRTVDAKIRKELPPRPWFQNEYEYLTGGATPDRCLNTVQHIMNSFQIGENPTWFWLHALKPIQNAEASGYSLGFWKSLIDDPSVISAEPFRRWPKGPVFTSLPEEFKKLEMVSAKRKDPKAQAVGYNFLSNKPVTVYLLVQDADGGSLEPEWEKTHLTAAWDGGTDRVYKRAFPAGEIKIPAHQGKVNGLPAAPHLAFLEPESAEGFKPEIGINMPIEIRSEALVLEKKIASVKPGHWITNPYNWHAVGSFAKRIPWDSIAVEIAEGKYDPDGRMLAFKRPDGKLSIVLSNRWKENERPFSIATGLPADTQWKGYRYTPEEAGEGTMGVPVGSASGAQLKPVLPPQSWEFWEQQ